MRRIATGVHGRIALALVAALALSACAKKNNGLPDNAAASASAARAASVAPAARAARFGRSGHQPGLHGQCRRPHLLRHGLDLDPRRRAADAGRQAQWLNQYRNYSITVEGHADERGTREYNLALGARRAAATRDYLASQGVSPNRMRTISYGKAPGGRLRRHLLLVAEPPRRHGAQRRRQLICGNFCNIERFETALRGRFA